MRTALLAVGLVALTSLPTAAVAGTTHAPASARRPIPLQILSVNDLHGNLEPPGGSSGQLTGSDGKTLTVGGISYLTTHVRQLREGHRNSLTVGAGDMIGASPQVSGLFEDEPTIAALKNLRLDVSSVGNHEFDQGVGELLRIRNGGCSPTLGCFGDTKYKGTSFPYLAANVVWKKSHRTILPPTWIKKVDGVPVGFIGMTLKNTPAVVSPKGIQDVAFEDEVETGRAAAAALNRRGVKSIVLLLHQGGVPVPADAPYDYDCNAGGKLGLSGDITTIAQKMDPRIDLIVSAHTHQSYVCDIADPSGRKRLVVQASSFGRAVNDTQLMIDRRTRDVIRSSVTSVNVPNTQDVTPAADQQALIKKWSDLAAPVTNEVVGSVTADLVKNANDRESSIVDLVADTELAAAPDAQLAFVNSGGVRAGLSYASSPAGEGDGKVTEGEAYTVLPFGDILQSVTLTGAQIEQVLEQQFQPQSDGSVKFRHLGVSKGFTYTYSTSAPVGSKVDPASIRLDGTVIDPAASYRVVINDFLQAGGDGFSVFGQGTGVTGAGGDLEALIAYLKANSPVAPPAADRATPAP